MILHHNAVHCAKSFVCLRLIAMVYKIKYILWLLSHHF